MADDFVTCVRARAKNQIQNARGNAGFFKYFDDANGSGRSDRRWFENYCVAGDQCRRDLPRGNCHRKVPGRDARHHAQRLLDRVDEIRRQLRKNRFAVHASRFTGAELSDIDRALQLAA